MNLPKTLNTEASTSAIQKRKSKSDAKFEYKDVFYDDYVGRLASKNFSRNNNPRDSYPIDPKLIEEYPYTKQMIENMNFKGVRMYK